MIPRFGFLTSGLGTARLGGDRKPTLPWAGAVPSGHCEVGQSGHSEFAILALRMARGFKKSLWPVEKTNVRSLDRPRLPGCCAGETTKQ